MEDSKASGMPAVVINGWNGRPTGGATSSDAGSDRFLMRESSSTKYLKICVAVAVVAVVIATGIGLALFFTLNRAVEKEEEIVDGLALEADQLADLHNSQEEMYGTEPLKVRLVGGLGDHQGRVSVMVDDMWGTICDKNWTHTEASAVCRSMGYRTGTAVPSDVHGPGFGNIALSDVTCPADSESLDMCDFNIADHTCSHLQDVAVTCTGDRGDVEPASFHWGSRRRFPYRWRYRRVRGCNLRCFAGGCVCRRAGNISRSKRVRNLRNICTSLTTTTTTTTVGPTSTTIGPSVPDVPVAGMAQDSGTGELQVVLQDRYGRRSRPIPVRSDPNGYQGLADYETYVTCCRFLLDP